MMKTPENKPAESTKTWDPFEIYDGEGGPTSTHTVLFYNEEKDINSRLYFNSYDEAKSAKQDLETHGLTGVSITTTELGRAHRDQAQKKQEEINKNLNSYK